MLKEVNLLNMALVCLEIEIVRARLSGSTFGPAISSDRVVVTANREHKERAKFVFSDAGDLAEERGFSFSSGSCRRLLRRSDGRQKHQQQGNEWFHRFHLLPFQV